MSSYSERPKENPTNPLPNIKNQGNVKVGNNVEKPCFF